MAPTSSNQKVGQRPRFGSRLAITREKTSIMATPTPAKITKFTPSTNSRSGMATVKNQLMGMEAIRARPPQLVVTKAAKKVVLTRSRDPDKLFKIYSAGNGKLQAIPAAVVNDRPQINMREAPPSTPMVNPYVVVPTM